MIWTGINNVKSLLVVSNGSSLLEIAVFLDVLFFWRYQLIYLKFGFSWTGRF